MIIKWLKRILGLVLAFAVYNKLGIFWAILFLFLTIIVDFIALLLVDQLSKVAFRGDGEALFEYMKGVRPDAPALVVILQMVVGPICSLSIPILMAGLFLGFNTMFSSLPISEGSTPLETTKEYAKQSTDLPLIDLPGNDREYVVSYNHYIDSMIFFERAMKCCSSQEDLLNLDSSKEDKVLKLLNNAIVESYKVTDVFLDSVHSEFKYRYKNIYIVSVLNIISGIKDNDTSRILQGLNDHEELSYWMMDNKDNLYYPLYDN